MNAAQNVISKFGGQSALAESLARGKALSNTGLKQGLSLEVA